MRKTVPFIMASKIWKDRFNLKFSRFVHKKLQNIPEKNESESKYMERYTLYTDQKSQYF